MKPWIFAIIFGTFGRFFNNPNLAYKLEERLANSAPVKQLARALVALFQRGSWELRQLKSLSDKPRQLDGHSLSEAQREALKKFKQFEEELKRKM